MDRVDDKYIKLGILASIMLLVMVMIQGLWMMRNIDLQLRENELQLDQEVAELAIKLKAMNPSFLKDPSSFFNEETILAIKDTIDRHFASRGIKLHPHFAVYNDRSPRFFISDQVANKSELIESKVKSCLSCIVSFSFAKGIEKEEGESEEAFAERLTNASIHEYFSPVSNLMSKNPDKPVYWLALYQPHSIWDKLKPQSFLFGLSILLLLGLVYLLFFLIKTFSEHKKNSEAKDDFFNNVTHEFKTPLASIRLASRVLRKSKDVQKNKTYHDLIEKESHELEKQIDGLLEYSLLDNKKIKLDKSPLDLAICITAAISRLQPLIELNQANITLNMNSNGRLSGDKYHLTNCFSNIIENSLKYAPNGVEINIDSTIEKGKLILDITDNGPGIEKAHIPHVFDRFYRGNKDNQYKAKGFGIGLSYVQFIIESHHGTVSCLPNDKGAHFKITLPYV